MRTQLFSALVDTCLALLYEGAWTRRPSDDSRQAAAQFLSMAYLCLSMEGRRHTRPVYRTLRRWMLADAEGARQAFYHLSLMRTLLRR